MKTEVTIDWLSVTLEHENAYYMQKRFSFGNKIASGEGKARFGYDVQDRYESGVTVMWSTKRADMGVHVVFTGSSLRWLTAKGTSVLDVAKHMRDLGARASRVDLAIDIFDSGLQQSDLCKPARLPYKGKGRTPKFTQVGDEEDGWTLYIGSRSSEKFLRIYDKAKESKSEIKDWKRIEIECKGMVAHWLGDALPEMDVSAVYQLTAQLCKTMVDFKVSQWTEALSSEEVALSIPKKTARDTIGWLVNQVAPALAKCVLENPNYDVMDEFHQAVQTEIAVRQAIALSRQGKKGGDGLRGD